jgi:hypothetical protein
MKFSIRDLLCLTVAVALGLGWWLDRSRLQRENNELTVRTQMLSGAMEGLGMKPSFDDRTLRMTKIENGERGIIADEITIQKSNYSDEFGFPIPTRD